MSAWLRFLDRVFIGLLLFFNLNVVEAANSTPSPIVLPGQAAQLLPILDREIITYWDDLAQEYRAFPAGVVDQESNWKIKATLKTSREWGCGLGQFTVAYDAKGNVRFDALEETKRLDPSLKDWNWRDCSAVQFQLRGLVLKLRVNNRQCSPLMKPGRDTLACGAAMYNGGGGSITKRIRSCRLQKGCKDDEWFGNLELQCPQAQTKVAGYGESFCEINSKYPGRVFLRMPKFYGFWPQEVVTKPP